MKITVFFGLSNYCVNEKLQDSGYILESCYYI